MLTLNYFLNIIRKYWWIDEHKNITCHYDSWKSVFRYLGKTSLLYKLSLGDFVTTKPTLGFNVETISYNNNTITLWDMGGTPSIRRLWKHYYLNCHGIYLTITSNVTLISLLSYLSGSGSVSLPPQLSRSVSILY